MQALRRAFSRAAARAGKSMPARIAIIAITTNSSINVNDFSHERTLLIQFISSSPFQT